MDNNRVEMGEGQEEVDVHSEPPLYSSLSSARADVLTTGQVARELRCSTQQVTNLCGRGTIPAFKVAGHWRITREEFNRFVESRRVQAERKRTLLTMAQVADRLCYSIDTIMLLCRKGEIPAEKIGRDWYVEPEVLKRLIEGKGGEG